MCALQKTSIYAIIHSVHSLALTCATTCTERMLVQPAILSTTRPHISNMLYLPQVLQRHTSSCQNYDDQSRQPVLHWCGMNTKEEKQFTDALWSSGSPSSFIHNAHHPQGEKKWRTRDLLSGGNKYPSRHEDHHRRGSEHPRGSDK